MSNPNRSMVFIGHPMVDVFASCPADHLVTLGIIPGKVQHVDRNTILGLADAAQISQARAGGGAYSAGLSFSRNGGSGMFLGAWGDSSCLPGVSWNVQGFPVNPITAMGLSGCCWYLDDRTIVAHTGAASGLTGDSVIDFLSRHPAEQVYLEGFVLPRFMKPIGVYAHNQELQINIDLGSASLTTSLSGELLGWMAELGRNGNAGVVFGTEDEIQGLLPGSWDRALAELSALGWESLIKFGSAGAVAVDSQGNRSAYEPRVKLPEPLVGAGDVFAGAYLATRLKGEKIGPSLFSAGQGVMHHFGG